MAARLVASSDDIDRLATEEAPDIAGTSRLAARGVRRGCAGAEAGAHRSRRGGETGAIDCGRLMRLALRYRADDVASLGVRQPQVAGCTMSGTITGQFAHAPPFLMGCLSVARRVAHHRQRCRCAHIGGRTARGQCERGTCVGGDRGPEGGRGLRGGQRGDRRLYRLFGDPRHLDSYRKAQQELAGALAQLPALVGEDGPRQSGRATGGADRTGQCRVGGITRADRSGCRHWFRASRTGGRPGREPRRSSQRSTR